jgi:aspartyl-tRNA synthetase
MQEYRTHTCNELTAKNIGQSVKLAGWAHSIRDHGKLLFIDLRDNYGITQCVIDVEDNKSLVDLASSINLESVICIEGKVVARPSETLNKNLPTGEIEIALEKIKIESMAEQLPFQINDETQNYPEELRLKYRYLDLRRTKLHKNIQMRSKVISFLRKQMEEQGFLEFQTPILTVSSPEGARDFLVPSRLYPGKFWALPQAPQQFKQLLMVAGFDKYFQIAPCFRDEDSRADRVLEFYQLDMEMSFATQEDVFAVLEPIFYNTFTHFSNKTVDKPPFIRIPYKEAMLKYGCDKPDLRNPLIISDVTEIFRDSNFAVFAKNIEQGAVTRAIPAPKASTKPRSFFDNMGNFAINQGAKGLGYIIFNEDGAARGPVAKFLDETKLKQLKEAAGLQNGDAVFFTCDREYDAVQLAGRVRNKLSEELDLLEKNVFKFCWIVDFPLYEISEETGELTFCHNPFSMPKGEIKAFDTKNLLNIVCNQYDIVCNGSEMLSGAVRNHKPEIMYKTFEKVGYSKEVVDDKFKGMINAFKFGVPPHAGAAPGIDRIVMLLLDEPNLREIIAFPPNGKGVDLMMGSPSEVSEKQLKELHIELSKKVKEEIKK